MIRQSVMQYSSSETDEEENAISGLNSHNSNNGEKSEHSLLASAHQWQNGNHSIHSHHMKHLTISVPNSRKSSSLAHTTVNDSVQSFAVFIKETTPQNVYRQERIGNIRSYSGEKGEEKQREERQVTVNCTVVAAEGRWIKHYSSCHRILLVGEGDFSFSKCLAAAFGFASNMVATSLDLKNYENALPNIVELGIRKCNVMHEIDATKIPNHPFLGEIKFDCIIFNFPFAGFFKDVSRGSQLRRHRKLVRRFLKNAREMINESGEIHITHIGFHMEWNLESLASSHRLRLVEAVDFSHLDYPVYNTKRGFWGQQ